MKSLIEELETIPAMIAVEDREKPADTDYVEMAKSLGFSKIASEKPEVLKTRQVLPYPEITDEAIRKMLSRRIDEMYQEDMGKPHSGFWEQKNKYNPILKFRASGEYPQVAWFETPIEEYLGLPPRHVLTALQRAKDTNIFERFVVVTVEEIVDPLLVGITSDNRRGLIDHWAGDISMDEVLTLTTPPAKEVEI